MSHNIKPFDVSMISTTMGKWATALLTVFVVGVAISALVTGSGSERNIVTIGVVANEFGTHPAELFEPLRTLVASETRRSALVVGCDGVSGQHDLYILPTAELLRHDGAYGLEAIYEVLGPQPDAAILIARPGDTVDIASLRPGDVAFAPPYVANLAINDCLVALGQLEADGFKVPASSASLGFGGNEGHGAPRALALLNGDYRVAAFRESDFASLLNDGVASAGSVRVLKRRPSLPETVIACPSESAGYYRKVIGRIAEMMENGDSSHHPTTRQMALQLLRARGVAGLKQIDPRDIEEARDLYRRFAPVFDRFPE